MKEKQRIGDYDVYGTLGRGTYGRVRYAVNRENGEVFALKIIDKKKVDAAGQLESMKNEVAILQMIEHKNVVCVKDMFATHNRIFLVLDCVMGGSLMQLLSRLKEGRLDERMATFYVNQILQGLEHIHSMDIVHGNLKLENIFLDGEGNAKITDFSLASLDISVDGDDNPPTPGSPPPPPKKYSVKGGSPNYLAPEVIDDKCYDGKKADVWSVGVIIYTLVASYLPFQNDADPSLINLLKRIRTAEYRPFPNWFSLKLTILLSSIFVPNASERPTVSEMIKSPWIIEEGLEGGRTINGDGQSIPHGAWKRTAKGGAEGGMVDPCSEGAGAPLLSFICNPFRVFTGHPSDQQEGGTSPSSPFHSPLRSPKRTAHSYQDNPNTYRDTGAIPISRVRSFDNDSMVGDEAERISQLRAAMENPGRADSVIDDGSVIDESNMDFVMNKKKKNLSSADQEH